MDPVREQVTSPSVISLRPPLRSSWWHRQSHAGSERKRFPYTWRGTTRIKLGLQQANFLLLDLTDVVVPAAEQGTSLRPKALSTLDCLSQRAVGPKCSLKGSRVLLTHPCQTKDFFGFVVILRNACAFVPKLW